MENNYQTDLEIIQDTDKLLQECIDWAIKTFDKKEYKNFTPEDIRAIGISRFIYLQGKLFNHSDKWHRDQQLKGKTNGKSTPIIKNG